VGEKKSPAVAENLITIYQFSASSPVTLSRLLPVPKYVIQWSRVLVQNLTVTELVKMFQTFMAPENVRNPPTKRTLDTINPAHAHTTYFVRVILILSLLIRLFS
jgi:hypothetical protein